jgi:OPT family oligopeptide transporter
MRPGTGTLIFGIVLVVLGVSVTLASEQVVWWGAIAVGLINVVRGIARMSRGEDAPAPAPAPLDAPLPAATDAPKHAPTGDPEVDWFRNVYRGDVPQFTLRSFIVGSLLGGLMALSNLYVGLKTGWGLGVAITACILSFAVYSALSRALPRVFGKNLTILENNAMQSVASSAGYSTGGTLTSAMAAMLMVQGHHMPWPTLMGWTFFLAVLGTVMAIPMKRQMINIEQLKFPSGIAAAETLKSLYGAGRESAQKARSLFVAMGVGAVIAWLRDAHATADATSSAFKKALATLTKASILPPLIEIPKATIRGFPLKKYTIGFEGSLILVAAGALMGLRTTASMLVAGLVNYGVVAPIAHEHGAIKDLGYRGIVSFSLWPGAACMVASGLLTFALQWRTVLRAFSGFGKAFKGKEKQGPYREADAPADELARARAEMDKIEVPSSWFVVGTLLSTVGVVTIGWIAFDLRPWLGVIAVMLAFVLSIVACRATGETDTTPVGAMGKITQLAYGILAPANVVTNLMTASITASSAGSSADLLTDLKSGYLLGANPRRQFLAQLSGTLVGTLVVVPAWYKLVPTPQDLGTDRFPAPSAQVWKGVAEVLAQGVESLHPWARWGMAVGAAIGVVLPLLELAFPKYKKWIPSAMGVGLALVIPCFNSISMFIGAVIAAIFSAVRKDSAEKYTVPVASGIIAGESLLGVLVALLAAGGYLD